MRRLVIYLAILLSLPTLCPGATIFVETGAGLDVNTGSPLDKAAPCSLELAIQSANQDIAVGACVSGSGPDVIEFLVEGVITLGADLSVITDDLEINGPGVDILTISGESMHRLFEFDGVMGSAVRNLTLEHGFSAANAGCILAVSSEVALEDLVLSGCEGINGGALEVQDTSIVTVTRSTFSGNSATTGGAVYANDSEVTIEASTFDGNFSPDTLGRGGALDVGNQATVDVHLSTFDGNISPHHGGAISISSSTAELTLTSSTIVNNIADTDGSGDGDGGGLYASNGMVTVKNTILASNEDQSGAMGAIEPDISFAGSATVVSDGHNMVGVNSGGETVFVAGTPNANQDQVGEGGTPLDPMLGSLGDFGGPTQTVPPLPELLSPVVDQGSCATESADQRGSARPLDHLPTDADDGCDIGAFELAWVFADGFESGDTSAWGSQAP